MGISVILPAFNEEKNLKRTVDRTLEALRDLFDEFEIIIVNDASTDQTADIAGQLAADHPEVIVVQNEVNLRQGKSLLKGFSLAKHDLIIHNGVDYPFDMRDLAKMAPLLDEADIVVATRTDRAAFNIYRKIISITNVTLLRILFPLRLSDYSFVQLYRKEVLRTVKVDAGSQGFVIPEILIRAFDRGFRIKSIPIKYHPREGGVATSGKLSIVIASFVDVIRFWWKRLRGK